MRRPNVAGTVLLACAFACACAGTARAEDDPWLGRDKLLHFGASAGIAAAGYGVGAALDDRRGVAIAVGAGAALVAGAGKEALDAAGYGHPSLRDFAWDVLGAAAGLALAWGVDALLRGPDAPRDPKASQAGQAALLRF